MTKVKNQQKRTEPQLLYLKNQAFLDGKLEYPVNTKKIMDTFAVRHYLSTIPNPSSWIVGFFLIFMSLIFIVPGALTVFALVSEWGVRDLPTLILMISIALGSLSLGFMGTYAGIVIMNYRPKRVNALYYDWLKRGQKVNATIKNISI